MASAGAEAAGAFVFFEWEAAKAGARGDKVRQAAKIRLMRAKPGRFGVFLLTGSIVMGKILRCRGQSSLGEGHPHGKAVIITTPWVHGNPMFLTRWEKGWAGLEPGTGRENTGFSLP